MMPLLRIFIGGWVSVLPIGAAHHSGKRGTGIANFSWLRR